jgi:hypothetical protein
MKITVYYQESSLRSIVKTVTNLTQMIYLWWGKIKRALPASRERALFIILAEREGFEPSVESDPHTRLAGEHHRPLGHLSP